MNDHILVKFLDILVKLFFTLDCMPEGSLQFLEENIELRTNSGLSSTRLYWYFKIVWLEISLQSG